MDVLKNVDRDMNREDKHACKHIHKHTRTHAHTHTHTHTHTLRNTFQYTSHTSTLANYDPCKLIQAYKETSRQSYTHFCVFNKFIINKQIKTNAKTFVRLMK